MDYHTFALAQFDTIKQRDASLKQAKEVFLYSFIEVLYWHQLAHKLYLEGDFYKARTISQKMAKKHGIEIHPGAQIGEGLFIDHGYGVVIGETAVVGNNVTICQGVTLGGTRNKEGKRHPTIEDNVMLSAGAMVLGDITVGANSKIGAGSVVLTDIPPNSTVVGIPGRVVKQDGKRVKPAYLEQIEFADPAAMDLAALQEENKALRMVLNRFMEHLDHMEKIIEEKKSSSRETVQV